MIKTKTRLPLISCIMPTFHQRKKFVEQAIHYFNNQDYPNTELIIIDGDDEGYDTVYNVVPAQSNIEYINVDMGGAECHLTIGAKRNLACSLAKGEIICYWDDDDYHGPQRLAKQAEPIIAGEADVTGLELQTVINLSTGEAWRCGSDALRREVFLHDIHTGTLMYRSKLWGNAYHPNKSNGEDADFLATLLNQGARLAKVSNEGAFIYIRHNHNTWPLPPMVYPHMEDWQCVKIEEHLSEQEQQFYRQFAEVREDVLTR